MACKSWRKVENEAGYPCYIDETTGRQQDDHPEYLKIIESLEEYDGIKYSTYRIAFKIFALQKHLRVPPLRIASGVFARHQLSLSETSLSLEIAELEAVLADIYFAAEKEGLFTGDVDLAVDLMINMLINVYDRDRKEPIRVLAAKILLIILSDESVANKWQALANSCADHNGCVSPRRLETLLAHLTALPQYLGCEIDQIQADVDACFDKSAGMLGTPAAGVAEWGAGGGGGSARWLGVTDRIARSRAAATHSAFCEACRQPLIQVLKFKCTKCKDLYFCEKCYLYDKDLTAVGAHKKTHVVHEIIDGEAHPSQCLSFMKTMRRFFFCTKTKKKKTSKKSSKKYSDKDGNGTLKRRKDGKPTMFTSTVGKASGHTASSPEAMLQDVIAQLEAQNKALKELYSQLEVTKRDDDALKERVNTHYNQISTQINRLKIVKENLALNSIPQATEKAWKTDRPQAFDFFSPIPEVKPSKVTENPKNQPRVLSLDSGNFSVTSKQTESPHLLTMSGDALKPVVVHATSDSISTVSMNDISSWYNENESLAPDKRSQRPKPDLTPHSQSISVTEQRFADDIRSVETSNDKMKELNADLDTVLDRLQQILTNNFAMDDSCFDNTQLRETANEMEGLLGTLIRGVEQRATLNATKGLV